MTSPVRLPAIDELIRVATRQGEQMIATLGRQYDPGSVSDDEAWPGMLLADLNLSSAVANVRQALRDLADLAKLRHPPVGSAVPVMFPSHLPHAGDRPTPGSAAALSGAVSESQREGQLPAAGDSLRHEPDRPGAPGLPPRPLNPRPPQVFPAPPPVSCAPRRCGCHMCDPRVSSW